MLKHMFHRYAYTIFYSKENNVCWLYGVLRQFDTVFQSLSGRLPEEGSPTGSESKENSKARDKYLNNPTRIYCKHSRP